LEARSERYRLVIIVIQRIDHDQLPVDDIERQ
jgi:hypothetical protein